MRTLLDARLLNNSFHHCTYFVKMKFYLYQQKEHLKIFPFSTTEQCLSALKKPRIQDGCRAFLVPPAGIEPAQYRYRGILSPLRLPVPPWRRNLIIAEWAQCVKHHAHNNSCTVFSYSSGFGIAVLTSARSIAARSGSQAENAAALPAATA